MRKRKNRVKKTSAGMAKEQNAASKYIVLRRDRAQKRLRKFLSRAPEPGFLEMMWGASSLESGRRVEGLKSFDITPPQIMRALDEKPYIFFKWTIETLVNEWLCIDPAKEIRGPNRRLNTRHLGAVAEAIRLMNDFENSEDGIVLQKVNVLRETSRIIQRQVPWQRGFVNKEVLIRASRLYKFDLTEKYFQENYGISLTKFFTAAFALYSQALHAPYISRQINLKTVGISDSERDAALRKLAAPTMESARLEAKRLRSAVGHKAYQPSVLRSWPLIPSSSNSILVAPLPELLIERGTNGLFYDFVSAGGEIRRTIGENFEKYCFDIMDSYLSSFSVLREVKYKGLDNQEKASADLAVMDGHDIQLVIECKARRASFESKFAEGSPPLTGSAADEITKAVVQIWRTVAHRRKGLLKWPTISDAAIGVVLTLDNWMEFAAHQKDDILDRAQSLASEDKSIIAVDRIPIIFTNISEVEFVLRSASDQDVLRVLRRGSNADRRGYMISSMLEECRLDPKVEKQDPFVDSIEAMFHHISSAN